MARHECCREIETAIFTARTNLPVLDFQTWQVCPSPVTKGKRGREREREIVFTSNLNETERS